MTDHAERDLLLDLAYGELDDRAARRVREHLAGCASCRAELDELQDTRRLMSALPELPAPERGERILAAAAREATERAVLQGVGGRGRAGRPRRHWLVPAVALAATVTLVSVVSIRLAREQQGPLPPEDDQALMKAVKAPAEAAAPAAPAAAPAGEKRDAGPARDEPVREDALREAAPRYAQAPPPAPSAPAKAKADRAPRRERAAASNAAEPAPAEELSRRDDAKGEGVVGGVSSFAGQQGAAPAEAEADAVASAPAPLTAPPAAPRRTEALERKAADSAEARGAVAPSAQPALVRAFPGCPGESRREIRRDAEGRVRRFAREGTAGGRRVRVELEFGPEGDLTASRGRDLTTGEAVPAGILPGLPRSAAQVDPDAPPSCAP